jgi:hypothetical protein
LKKKLLRKLRNAVLGEGDVKLINCVIDETEEKRLWAAFGVRESEWVYSERCWATFDSDIFIHFQRYGHALDFVDSYSFKFERDVYPSKHL